MSEQARALRVRTFIGYLQKTPGAGAYAYIGTPSPVGGSAGRNQHPALFPTTLRRLTGDEFDRLANHGYQVAKGITANYPMFTAGGPEAAESP